MNKQSFPQEIIIDTSNKDVYVDSQVAATLPGIDRAFEAVDQAFLKDPEAYLQKLQDALCTFRSSTGAKVACSFLYDTDKSVSSDEALVIFAPLSDAAPKSSSDQLYHYITSPLGDGLKGVKEKEAAAPNSWSQTTKSAVIFELLTALGKNMPVLTIYSPIPLSAYSRQEQSRIASGDFSPASRIAEEAIAAVKTKLSHEDRAVEINNLHFAGASLGGANAVAAGSAFVHKGYGVKSVTAQELVMGPKGLFDLAHRFMFNKYVGGHSTEERSNADHTIQEPAMRRQINMYGSELIGMNVRMMQGMKLPYMRGLTAPAKTVQAIENLLDKNVSVLVALASDSAMTYQTRDYLPNMGEKVLSLSSKEGRRLGHLANEYVALSSLVMALNILRG